MKLEVILKVSMGFLLSCTTFFMPFAQAEDYVKQSQINVANGVAGLNGSGQVTANVNNGKDIHAAAAQKVGRVFTNNVELMRAGDRLRFVTNSADPNNNEVDMFYNNTGLKDNNDNLLDNNTFYFTNNKYGNNYKFNGGISTDKVFSNNIYIGKEVISPYNTNIKSSLIFLNGDGNNQYDIYALKNTLMLGGKSRNSLASIKASCKNIGGGDLGGSCYQFTDMGGVESNNRGGAGGTDGINMDMRSSSTSPLDSIGGNKLDSTSYTLTGNTYKVVPYVPANSTEFQVAGKVDCGDTDKFYCEMSNVDVYKYYTGDDGKINTAYINSISVKVVSYDEAANITTLQIGDNYKLRYNIYQAIKINKKLRLDKTLVDTNYFVPNYSQTNAGLNTFAVEGTFGCGVGGGSSKCEMKGISFLDPNKQYIIDPDGYLMYAKVLHDENGKEVVDQSKYQVNEDGFLLDQQGNIVKTGTYFVNKDGYLIDANKDRVYKPVTVSAGKYDPRSNRTEITLPFITQNGVNLYYTLKNDITSSDNIMITFYSADGVAYGVSFGTRTTGEKYALIYPALSPKEAGLLQDRISIWTNIANGMSSQEGGTNEDLSNVDMPNYYYGYKSATYGVTINQELATRLKSELNTIQNDTTTTATQKDALVEKKQQEIRNNQYTQLVVQSYYYPGTEQTKNGWRTFKSNSTGGSANPAVGNPLSSSGDQYDYQLTYKKYATDKFNTPNSNYHQYSQPALFIGLNRANINLYSLQHHLDAPDSITREYGNEWDFWMSSNKGAVSSKGLALTWVGANQLLPKGSFMMRLAGGTKMPTGLLIDGVWPYGGKTIGTDAGFFVFNNSLPVNTLEKLNSMMTASALGQIRTGNTAYQLFNYGSNDGKANNSLHFGLTKRLPKEATDSLKDNTSPTCAGNTECSVLGQVIFDPLGYVGGIALGSGQGENTKLGIIVDKDNNAIVTNKLTVNGQSVNDAIEKANNAIPQSQMNVANGVVGLNANKQVTANILSTEVAATNLRGNMLNINAPSATKDVYPIRFNTGSSDSNNNKNIDIFYNGTMRTDDWGNNLDANTLYFSNHHYGMDYSYDQESDKVNQYKFEGRVTSTQKISALSFQGKLSTPSSSSASCNAGEFKDDTNYHYVCVSQNKWKRVALSDF